MCFPNGDFISLTIDLGSFLDYDGQFGLFFFSLPLFLSVMICA